MYGCPGSVMTMVMSRLSNCGLSTFHPLTLPMIFADIERNRHMDMVDEYIRKLMQRVLNMDKVTQTSTFTSQTESPGFQDLGTSSFSSVGDYNTVLDWLEMNHIRSGLRTWQTQLKTLINHLPELEMIQYGKVGETEIENILTSLKIQGVRIKERLTQVINEYDEKVRECSTCIDGMTFSTQMEWNQIARADTGTNLKISKSTMEISRATQRDGSQMRSIALLTMIFLPGTFVATIFSMSFFNWKLKEDVMISPQIWIYAVITALLTVVTIGIWHYFTVERRDEKKGILPL
ncbi:hypothetical protein M434DRAFT_15302 [Hypoxylon sp. CO27-5]|nr:hypothetical protein M434DRAFT_15302 [Hypoxylon sp. CO27-5]